MNTGTCAAKGITGRVGAGKVRHLQASQTWIQEKVMRKELEIRKTGGDR